MGLTFTLWEGLSWGLSITEKHERGITMLTFKVQDMTCNHCASAITRAVKEVDADAKVDVQVAEKRVNIDSSVAAAEFEEAIKEAGYTPVAA